MNQGIHKIPKGSMKTTGGAIGVRLAPTGPASAFTLIEMVISSALMTVILASAYLCFSSGIWSQRMVETRADAIQTARVAMAMMSADLRAACPISKDYDFLGMDRMLGEIEADKVDFATHHYSPNRPQEADYCVVSYYLRKDPESGELALWRRRLPFFSAEPLTGGTREEIAGGLRGLRFEYYDGYDWYDDWGEPEGRAEDRDPNAVLEAYNLYGLPEAVRITLWVDPEPAKGNRDLPANASTTTNAPPLVFKTLVRLNLASVSQGSTPGAGGSNSISNLPGNTPERPGH